MTDINDAIQRYLAGASLLQISKETGKNRGYLARRLRQRHIPLRGRSEAECLKWAHIKQSPALVKRQLEGAWQASRGRQASLTELIARAKTNFQRLVNRGKLEDAAIRALRRACAIPTAQLPIGPYNVDIALKKHRVAVEIQTAWLEGGRSTKPKRLNYLMQEGWAVLIIASKPRPHHVTGRDLAHHIIAFAKRARRDHPAGGCYGVIWSNGQPVTRFRLHDHQGPRVLGF